MQISDWIAIGSVAVSVGSFVYTRAKDSGKEIEELKLDVRDLKTKVEVFWKNVSYDAARTLHTPHPENARRDYLLEQYVDEKITRGELMELVQLLKTLIESGKDFGEKQAASILLRTIEQRFTIK